VKQLEANFFLQQLDWEILSRFAAPVKLRSLETESA
jgi:hypothetical protein